MSYITTDAGVIVPDTSEIKTQVTDEFNAISGGSQTIEASSYEGRQIDQKTTERIEILRQNATVANFMNPNQAFGVFLDNHFALMGAERPAGMVDAVAKRYLKSVRGVSSTGARQSIRANVGAIDGVYSVQVLDNVTAEERVESGVTLDPGSTWLCVDIGGEDNLEDISQELGETFYRSRAGAITADQNSYNVRYSDGFGSFFVPISLATEVQVSCKIEVETRGTSEPDKDVKNAILAYANRETEYDGFVVGSILSSFDMASSVKGQVPEVFVRKCSLDIGDGFTSDDIPLAIYEVGRITSDDIEVTIV